MTKQQVIDILEAYKPSGNIYNGYNSIEEKIDERICYLIDEIIGRVKQEQDDDGWIEYSVQAPDDTQDVIFYDALSEQVLSGYYDKENKEFCCGDYDFSDNYMTHWMPFPEPPKGEK